MQEKNTTAKSDIAALSLLILRFAVMPACSGDKIYFPAEKVQSLAHTNPNQNHHTGPFNLPTTSTP